MAKLGRKQYPSGHGPDDFECFGPPATEDGKFEGCMLADLGCFNQEEIDSNKFYHGAVVKSKKSGKWYAYFEWGRTGQTADFLFEECYSKEEAQEVFAKQLHSKNDRRGEWAQVAGRTTLRAKAGKDCYLVRPAARRTTGLPDARKIIHAESTGKSTQVVTAKPTTKAVKDGSSRWDAKTLELARALTGATIAYTRKSFAGDYIPTQSAIEFGRDILTEAMKRVQKVGDNTANQVKDTELKQLTTELYSRIPKTKPVGSDESTWILSGANIQAWQLDIDAFESALLALDAGGADVDTMDDPFSGFDLEMRWMDPKTVEGQFVQEWLPKASGNKHYHVGDMKILNMWAVRQPHNLAKFNACVIKIGKETKEKREQPKFQPSTRLDLSDKEIKAFRQANVALLMHGTRSINVSSILRTGLKLPKELTNATTSGAMFGALVYHADDWRKSAGYCSLANSYWAGGDGKIASRGAFMYLSDCVLGNPYVAPGPRGYTQAPDGFHCIFGKAGHSGVQNNEWVLPTTAQNHMRYLVEFVTR